MKYLFALLFALPLLAQQSISDGPKEAICKLAYNIDCSAVEIVRTSERTIFARLCFEGKITEVGVPFVTENGKLTPVEPRVENYTERSCALPSPAPVQTSPLAPSLEEAGFYVKNALKIDNFASIGRTANGFELKYSMLSPNRGTCEITQQIGFVVGFNPGETQWFVKDFSSKCEK